MKPPKFYLYSVRHKTKPLINHYAIGWNDEEAHLEFFLRIHPKTMKKYTFHRERLLTIKEVLNYAIIKHTEAGELYIRNLYLYNKIEEFMSFQEIVDLYDTIIS